MEGNANGRYKEYLFIFYREQDREKFEELLKKENALWWQFIEIPFPNIYGQLIGRQFGCIYIHTKELGMETLC